MTVLKIYIDADACPVVTQAEAAAREFGVQSVLVCDSSHALSSSYSQIITTSKGADSADFLLLSLLKAGDIVVTQDYGLAALSLARGAKAINQNGMLYTEDNIDMLLNARHFGAKLRRSGLRTRGPAKRTEQMNEQFDKSFKELIKASLL